MHINIIFRQKPVNELYGHGQRELGLVKAFNYWETIDGQGQHNHNILQAQGRFCHLPALSQPGAVINVKMH